MKEKGNISRKQFITGSATVVFGAILNTLSGHVYAENSVGTLPVPEKGWEQLPIDILSGARLISDPSSAFFGGTEENAACLLTQYIHVYPGLEIMLSFLSEDNIASIWIGYSKELSPLFVLPNNRGNRKGDNKTSVITVPENVYFLRGSCAEQEGKPRVWVKSFAQYVYACGLNRPDLSTYTEITNVTAYQHSRKDGIGLFDEATDACPAFGDVFFTPIGTEIVITFQNANIAPYIHSGENYMSTSKRQMFTRYCGFGYSWYYCRTAEPCNWLGACYETVNGYAKPLTLAELQAADPHFYIRFPSHVTQTLEAARIRTKGASSNHERLFTVVHVTDTHGDMDSTHAVYKYADQIGANFIALTGDCVPGIAPHGYSMLHSIIKKARTPTVFTLGNHDVYYHTDQVVYEKSILPIRDAIEASEQHPYYFRDFEYKGECVRAISLYPFYDNEETRGYGYYSQEQLLWLCDAMATVPDGGHIFILRHFSHHKPVFPDGYSAFYDYASSEPDLENLWLCMREDPVIAVVDAYNEKKQIFAQYIGDLIDGKETITVKYDFTNRPDSEFVSYFTGHEHIDAIGYARNAKTRQAVLCSLCTTGFKGSSEYDAYTLLSSPRDYGTDSQISFNVFTFDFNNKKIYAARVGNGLFKDLEKTWMELSYK